MSSKEEIQEKLKGLPNAPGIYKFLDRGGTIIYIGKAKNIKNRVSSYFQKPELHNMKTKLLIKRVANIDIILVNNEQEALLLENSLIKENQPRYNILLKDDKTYPWICITYEEYPRIYITRQYDSKRGDYFGPFTSKNNITYILKSIRQIVPFRTCKINMVEEKVLKGQYDECLEYHIKNCNAPCTNKQSKEEYNENIAIIKSLLKGKTKEIVKTLELNLKTQENELKYEKAEKTYKQIQLIKEYNAKNSIVNPNLGNIDSLCIVEKDEKWVANYMQIREGTIVLSSNKEVKNPLSITTEELLGKVAERLKQEYESRANILISNLTSSELDKIYPKVEFPQRGEKASIIKLGEMNAKKYLANLVEGSNRKVANILKQIQEELSLTQLPYRIECIDNSNTLGQFPVSACVTFINGKPKKSEYRIYNIKEVAGPDDYATMREVIKRKFDADKEKTLPNLLVIDGGKGQLGAVKNTLQEMEYTENFDIISIAEKNEEIYVPRGTSPIILNKNSLSLRLIQQIRDEAHRFAIAHHRRKRDKNSIKSELEKIKGIGSKTIQKLYETFHSVEEMKKNREKVEKCIGKEKTRILFEHVGKRIAD